MGTWGHGPFDNDTALDLVRDVNTGTFSLRQLQFEYGQGPLTAQQAESVIAFAALVAGQNPSDTRVPDSHIRLSGPDRWWLRTRLRQALRPGGSDIYEFWADTGELDRWLAACSRISL